MNKLTQYCVYIGRFQPFTSAHIESVQTALNEAEKVILIIGSAESPISMRNLFTLEERTDIIETALIEPGIRDRVLIKSVPDSAYNVNAWTAKVQEIVEEITTPNDSISIIGHFKDDSSYYLNNFPSWNLKSIPSLCSNISATDIRIKIYEHDDSWKTLFSNAPCTAEKIGTILSIQSERVNNVISEYEFIKEYKKRWESAPFPPVFVTTDAVVLCKSHILLIRRKLNPGKGKLALPGGFLSQNESITDSALRELREETKIDVPFPILKSSISGKKVFDHPQRDPRGRTITHAFLFELNHSKNKLPAVKAADDAKEVYWIPLGKLDELAREFFNDHLMIIKYFLGRSM